MIKKMYIDINKEIDFKKIGINFHYIHSRLISYAKIESQEVYWKSRLHNLILRASFNLLPDNLKQLVKTSNSINKYELNMSIDVCYSYVENLNLTPLTKKINKIYRKLEKLKQISDNEIHAQTYKILTNLFTPFTPNTIKNLVKIDKVTTNIVLDFINISDFLTHVKDPNYDKIFYL